MPVDPSASVAQSARVHPGAVISSGARIGEFCIVESDVVIGPGCLLEPYVYVKRWTTLGDRNEISAGTVLGTDPLDKGFSGERSYLRIGNRNTIREHYTISRGTAPESATEIGDDNYIMTSGHIAHNCKIGNQIVIASCALLAGYVEVEDEAFISGGVVIHQYSKIGRLAMIGGNTRVNSDVPPFFLYGCWLQRSGQGSQSGWIEARWIQTFRDCHVEEGLPDSLPFRPQAGRRPRQNRNRNCHAGSPPTGGLRPPESTRHLPGIKSCPPNRRRYW